MSRKKIVGEVSISKLVFPNKGIGYVDGKKVTVKNSLVGQKLEVLLSRKKGGYEGRLLRVLEKSSIEIDTDCVDFGICGGCAYQNIPYEEELKIKETMVLDLLSENDIIEFEYLGIEGAKDVRGYRNKMEFSFGDFEKGGSLQLGMRKRQSFYEVVTSKNCNIIDEDYRKVLLTVLDFFENSSETFYHKSTHMGSLRNLSIRKGFFTGEILINLITTSTFSTSLNPLLDILQSLNLNGKIVGFLHTENDSVADVVKADKLNIIYGRDYFYEELMGLKFKISAFSFFQTNSQGAEQLYKTVKEFIGTSENKIIFDLYCGTGTIGQIVSENTKELIGVEIIPEAVQVAQENATLNNIKNCKFIAGDVFKVVNDIEVKADIIVLDPPRDGINPKAISKIVDFEAEKIVYVSCKPTSLARDLKAFSELGYKIERIKCHDLFPRTNHVECVVLMSKVQK